MTRTWRCVRPTKTTTACFEPSLDYLVVKIPRWDTAKFQNVSETLGSSMRSVGEVMAIGRCFEEALQKAIRMVSDGNSGFEPGLFKGKDELTEMQVPTPNRLFAIAVRQSSDSIQEPALTPRLLSLSIVVIWKSCVP